MTTQAPVSHGSPVGIVLARAAKRHVPLSDQIVRDAEAVRSCATSEFTRQAAFNAIDEVNRKNDKGQPRPNLREAALWLQKAEQSLSAVI